MKKSLRDQEKTDALAGIDIKQAARLLGHLGGKAGTGKAKARPSEVCRAAVNKRWDAYRKEKMSRRNIRAD